MELMDKSLHHLYKLVYEKLKLTIPEEVIGKMAEAVSWSHSHSHFGPIPILVWSHSHSGLVPFPFWFGLIPILCFFFPDNQSSSLFEVQTERASQRYDCLAFVGYFR